MKVVAPPSRRHFTILFLAILFLAAGIEDQIQQQMKNSGATSVGIFFENFNGKEFTYNPEEVFHAASTMKVPVMMEVFHQIEAGKVKLDQSILVKNEFKSIIDGSSYALSKDDDSDNEVYTWIGKTMTLRDLLQHMINSSSNLATNLILQLVEAQNVMNLMKQIGAKDMTVLRGVEDEKAYEAGKNNTTSARALATCLKAIEDPKLFQESSRKAMFDILHSQHFRDGIPAGIKENEHQLIVGNKDGWITEINHDSAIIQDAGGHTAYMVILTRGVKEEKDGKKLIAALADLVWNLGN